MRVIASLADTGRLVKYTFGPDTDTSDPNSAQPEIFNGENRKGDPVVAMVYGSRGLFTGRKNGEIAKVDLESLEAAEVLASCPNIVGLHLAHNSRYLVYAGANGKGGIIDLRQSPEKRKTVEFEVTNDLTSFAVHSSVPEGAMFQQAEFTKIVAAAGGSAVLPFLVEIDINSGDVSEIWKAKTPFNDKYDLAEKNLVTQLNFIPGKDYRLVVGTSHGKLRIYETEENRRPTSQTEISKYSIKAVVSVNDSTVLTADSQMKQSIWSIKPVRLLGHYKGVTGSTQNMAVRGRYVASGGLDRYLRVYEITSRKPAGKIYAGQELSAVAIIEDEDEKRQAEEQEIWDDLDQLERNKKRSKKATPNSEVQRDIKGTDSEPQSDDNDGESASDSELDSDSGSGSESESDSESERKEDISDSESD